MTPGRYRLLPHTADLRVEVVGEDLREAFVAAVEALFSLLTDRRRVRRRERRTLTVPAGSPEDQLLAILRRALLLHSGERFLVRDASVRMKGREVEVSLSGETMDPARHAVYREIKAVTGHDLAVEAGARGVSARFLLDV